MGLFFRKSAKKVEAAKPVAKKAPAKKAVVAKPVAKKAPSPYGFLA